MKLSIIIVNYNVKYFLEQCLSSVFAAISNNTNIEVFVVDNNSMDDSVDMVSARFPTVKLIASKENLGFSKGNNLAIKKAIGEYILLLNPDTIVQENTFSEVIEYMDLNTNVGGLGVKMLDGKGVFLPESKRGLPTPKAAFFKIFGLSRLFPQSKKFGTYHLSYLDKDTIHEIDILSGAFMFMRKKVLDKVGLLDEDFFMYGEDIDLSYRIQKGGFKNIYFPNTQIIHYKGESTKKSSINYVFVFYNAMIIFAKKHFSGSNANTFSLLINIAIYFRAALALLKRLVSQFFLPLIDFISIVGGLFLAKEIYHYWTRIPYEDNLVQLIFPIYGFIWVFLSFLWGGYDKPIKLINNLKGILIGSATILIFYSLLNESIRFSRALTLIGCVWAILITLLIRLGLHFLKIKEYRLADTNKKIIGIVGADSEIKKTTQLLQKKRTEPIIIIPITNCNSINKSNTFKLKINQIKEGQKLFHFNEIIFCKKNISYASVIKNMSQYASIIAEYKIATDECIIGVSCLQANNDVYKTQEIEYIISAENKRKKIIFDYSATIILLLLSPFWIGKPKLKVTAIANLLSVLIGSKSIVSYNKEPKQTLLPRIKKGILSPKYIFKNQNLTSAHLHKQNINYAQNYSPKQDFNTLLKALKSLDNKL